MRSSARSAICSVAVDAACRVGARSRTWSWPRVDPREDLRAEPRRRRARSTSDADDDVDAATTGQRTRTDALDDRPIAALADARTGCRAALADAPVLVTAQQPDGQDRHERARQADTTHTIENPTASDSGTNIARAAPTMKNDGTNTASTHSIAIRSGSGHLAAGVDDRARDALARGEVRYGRSRSPRSTCRPGCRSRARARRAS